MTLLEKQWAFSRYLGKLLSWAEAQDLHLTLGECWRTPQQAAWNEAHGLGIKNSLHISRLAVDLNLFVDGVWQIRKDAYQPLADYWLALSPGETAWGGNFSAHHSDPAHFSLSHEGVQ